MPTNNFKPHHMNATPEDFLGNNGIGRYLFMPGSDGRAQQIAENFSNVVVKEHPRAHNLYLGDIEHNGKKVAVGSISSGMGCPSLEIIHTELLKLGAKRFLRVGTAGCLQPELMNVGDLVIAQAAVRDDGTSQRYVPAEVPALASLDMVAASSAAAKAMGVDEKTHVGTVHCKDSFNARQFGEGPSGKINQEYMQMLRDAGVLASEMETSQLFIASGLYHYQLSKIGKGPQHAVKAGAVLGIIGDGKSIASQEVQINTILQSIELAIETIKQLAEQEV